MFVKFITTETQTEILVNTLKIDWLEPVNDHTKIWFNNAATPYLVVNEELTTVMNKIVEGVVQPVVSSH